MHFFVHFPLYIFSLAHINLIHIIVFHPLVPPVSRDRRTLAAYCAPHSFFSALARKERTRRARCKKEKGRLDAGFVSCAPTFFSRITQAVQLRSKEE